MMIAEATNAFGVEVWKRASAKDNYVLSPASIAMALAMAWTGARGKTADELRRVLHLEGGVDEVARAFGDTGKALRSDALAIANRLFGDARYPFEPAFVQRLATAFGAPFEALDFANEPERARVHINAWVEEQTKKKIADLIPKGSIDPMTRLVIVNAIYFLGKWLAPFDKAMTSNLPFWTTATTSTHVPTMRRKDDYRVGAIDGGEIIELPYKGGATAMYVVVPEARDGLAKLERTIDFAKWRRGLAEETVQLSLPRFEVAPPMLALKPVLEALGMPTAFDPSRADFGGISNPPDPRDGLFVTAVFHKAFVKTDEEGTVAAAATAAVFAMRGGPPPPPKPFTVDRPFLFFIADIQSGLVLFLGRVVDPSK